MYQRPPYIIDENHFYLSVCLLISIQNYDLFIAKHVPQFEALIMLLL